MVEPANLVGSAEEEPEDESEGDGAGAEKEVDRLEAGTDGNGLGEERTHRARVYCRLTCHPAMVPWVSVY